MKLIIQIPCFNEEKSLPQTLRALPRRLPGIDEVDWLVVNDGSSDRTVEVARECGVEHIVDLRTNQGLARAFMAGLEGALKAGADLIVNTDADNQYCADDIPKLLEPILAGRAEIVIGARPIRTTAHFSLMKKLLQRLGSWVVRMASGSTVADAPSGFRAFSRNAALRLRVFNNYTYTLETVIQAAQSGLQIESVPIRTNPDLRPSRLVRSIPTYVYRSVFTIGRVFLVYRPWRFFFGMGATPFLAGVILICRWLYFYSLQPYTVPARHLPSLVVAVALVIIGFQMWVLGCLAELQSANRCLLEDLLFRQRVRDLAGPAPAGRLKADAARVTHGSGAK